MLLEEGGQAVEKVVQLGWVRFLEHLRGT